MLLYYEQVHESIRTYVCERHERVVVRWGKYEGQVARGTKTKWPRRSPISILIELNATSYLMPETRQKLQLNGRDGSLYLFVHSSRLLGRSSAVAHRLYTVEFNERRRPAREIREFVHTNRCRFLLVLAVGFFKDRRVFEFKQKIVSSLFRQYFTHFCCTRTA